MATHTRPFLITGAALASAAAIVAASPAFAPSNALPSPAALSSAKYQLATFADIFTIPSSEWVASYFQGYGGVLGPTVTANPTPPPATVSTPNPYAPQCDNNCTVAGVSGVLYLFADALINGDGKGWSDSANWATSGINYFDEAGLSTGIEYLAHTAVGSTNPLLQTAIALFFAGPIIVTQLYTTALTLTATLVSQLPLVGPYVAGGINAYLGNNGYTKGLSGVLNYVIDLVTGNINNPVTAASAASTLAASVAAPAAAVQSAVSRASSLVYVQVPSVASVAAPSAPAVASRSAVSASEAVAQTKSESTSTDNSADNSTESASTESSSTETSTEPTSTESTSTESTSTDTSTEPTKPAEPTKTKSVDSPSSAAAGKPAESPAKGRKHPVRDAVAKVSKQINSALGGAAKAAAGSASGSAS